MPRRTNELTTQVRPATQIFVLAYILFSIGVIGSMAALLVVKSTSTNPAKPAALYTCRLADVDTAVELLAATGAEREAFSVGAIASTEELRRAVENGANTSTLLVKAQSRKALFLQMAITDPAAALKNISEIFVRERFTSISKNCVEQRKSFEGVVVEEIAENFETGEHLSWHRLRLDDGTMLNLLPSKSEFGIPAGSRISVWGFALDNYVLFDSISDVAQLPLVGEDDTGYGLQQYRSQDAMQGEQKTIVIMGIFANNSPTGVEPNVSQMQESMESVQSYYDEVSRGLMTIGGQLDSDQAADVRGWVNLDINTVCDRVQVVESAMRSVDTEIDFSLYRNVVVYAPMQGLGCGYGGIASLGDFEQYTTNDGQINLATTWVLTQPSFFQDYFDNVTIHEMGHLIGLHHATKLVDRTFPLNDGSDIYSIYGDPYDVMGTCTFRGQFDAPHKEALGWLPETNIETVFESGQYTIFPYELAGTGLQVVKIPRSSIGYLTIEYRQPIGTDEGLPASVFTGALLHLTENLYSSILIDPDDPLSHASYVLAVGQSVTDPATGTVITVESATAGQLVVSVEMGNIDFTPPTVSVSNPIPPRIIQGSVVFHAAATDPSGIQRVALIVEPGDITVCEFYAPPYDCLFDSTIFEDGEYGLRFSAWDIAGNVGYSSSWFHLIANNGAPQLFLSIPNFASIRGQTDWSIDVINFPDIFLTTSALWMLSNPGADGMLKTIQDPSVPYEFTLNTTAYPNNLYNLIGLAMTIHGSSVTKQITVRIDNANPLISFQAPWYGQTIQYPMNILVNSSDTSGIRRVEYYSNEESEPFYISYQAPWSGFINPINYSTGLLKLRAVAYDRAGELVGMEGNQGTTEIIVTIQNNFICGDIDGSQQVNISDIIYLLNYIFAGGEPPSNFITADVNGSGQVDISDAIYLIGYIFNNGNAPTCSASGFVQPADEMTQNQTLEQIMTEYPEVFRDEQVDQPSQ